MTWFCKGSEYDEGYGWAAAQLLNNPSGESVNGSPSDRGAKYKEGVEAAISDYSTWETVRQATMAQRAKELEKTVERAERNSRQLRVAMGVAFEQIIEIAEENT